MSSSSEPGLSDFGTCWFILFYCSFYESGFKCVIQNPELGISAAHKINEESELPQTGPRGSACPEQRDSFAGQ